MRIFSTAASIDQHEIFSWSISHVTRPRKFQIFTPDLDYEEFPPVSESEKFQGHVF